MVSTLVSDYAWYWPVACFGLAAVFTAISYYRNRRLADFQPWKKYLLAALRFTALLVLMLLMLNIFVRRNIQRTEKPILAVAIDNSESVVMRGTGAADSLRQLTAQLVDLADQLSDKYNVRFFSFGDNTRLLDSPQSLDFQDKYTDISQMLESMQSTLYNTNAGALILCTDGVYNRGQNPVYPSSSLGQKIHTITLGDTTAYCDLGISNVVYNETAFKGNEFPLQLNISARKLKGRQTVLEVSHNGKVEFSSNIEISSDNFFKDISTSLKANDKGLQKYTITLRPLDGEITTINNTRDILVDVVDDKHKILILSAMPHPDVAAIRNALSINRGFDIEVATLDGFSKSLSSYNLVVLVQIPSLNSNGDNILADIKNKNIPSLFVLGTQTDFEKFSASNHCLSVSKKSDSFEEVSFQESARFSLLSFDNGVSELLQKVPPLYCPFGDYSAKASSQVFGTQIVRGVPTDKPLIIISEPSVSRQAVIVGEGIWRWRIDCYKRYLNHEKFDLMMSRLCQYLITRADRERFVVSTRRIFGENEPVYFNAKVLDESLDPDPEAQVSVDVVDGGGKTVCSPRLENSGNGYYVRIDNIAPGSYTYTARAVTGGKTLTKSGIFSVSEIKTEAENLIANQQLLSRISAQTGGNNYSPDQIGALLEALENDTSIRPVSYSDITMASLLTYKWLFVLLTLLLSAEWFLRKFWGTL